MNLTLILNFVLPLYVQSSDSGDTLASDDLFFEMTSKIAAANLRPPLAIPACFQEVSVQGLASVTDMTSFSICIGVDQDPDDECTEAGRTLELNTCRYDSTIRRLAKLDALEKQNLYHCTADLCRQKITTEPVDLSCTASVVAHIDSHIPVERCDLSSNEFGTRYQCVTHLTASATAKGTVTCAQ